MAVNGTSLLNDLWNTIFSPFSDILGGGFWLIPIGFISIALFIKTRNVTASSMWLLCSCSIMGSGELFTDFPEMSFIYYLFAIIGLVGVIVSLLFMHK